MSQTPDLKGSSFTLSVLHLSDNEVEKSIQFLKKKVEQAPTFFTSAPVVINIANVAGEVDFSELKKGIKEAGLIPVGITGSKDEHTQSLASQAGFAIMSSSKPPTKASNLVPTKVVRTPIRSGQQVYAKNADLVVLNHVSPGAEVIADGSIHIHGTLRGRAIAGASGSTDAKIICNDLQAELVSVAGNYWLSDQIDSEVWQKKVMLSMSEDMLHYDILTI